jgi:MFS family permease
VTTFKRSLPITLTSFINKSGTIGLSIVPILLVERHISSGESAWIVGAIRAAGLAGVLVGGWSCDLLGLRTTLLLSFLVSGAGLALMPVFSGAWLIALTACLAQLGTSLYYASARLLLTRIVGPRLPPASSPTSWRPTA